MLSVMSLGCRPAARPTQPQGTVRIHHVEGQADDHQISGSGEEANYKVDVPLAVSDGHGSWRVG